MAKFKVGDKVHVVGASWESPKENKYVYNAVVTGSSMELVGSSSNKVLIYKIKLATKSYKDWTSDVDFEEMDSLYKDPNSSFFYEDMLKKGWVKKEGWI